MGASVPSGVTRPHSLLGFLEAWTSRGAGLCFLQLRNALQGEPLSPRGRRDGGEMERAGKGGGEDRSGRGGRGPEPLGAQRGVPWTFQALLYLTGAHTPAQMQKGSFRYAALQNLPVRCSGFSLEGK